MSWGESFMVVSMRSVSCELGKVVSSSILPKERGKSTPVQIASNCGKVPLELDITVRKGSSPLPWASTSLTGV